MDEQGGAGGVPLEGGGKQERRRKAHAGGSNDKAHADRRDGTTPAADTDEASRLDRPQQPGKPGGKPSGKGTRWVSPRDE